jgi:hypothetical protein
MTKTELDVKFVRDVVLACYILHNMVTGAEEVQIEELMCVLALEAHNDMYVRDPGHHQYDETTCQQYNARLEDGEIPGNEYRRNVVACIGHCILMK